jgi:hypothetical protein
MTTTSRGCTVDGAYSDRAQGVPRLSRLTARRNWLQRGRTRLTVALTADVSGHKTIREWAQQSLLITIFPNMIIFQAQVLQSLATIARVRLFRYELEVSLSTWRLEFMTRGFRSRYKRGGAFSAERTGTIPVGKRMYLLLDFFFSLLCTYINTGIPSMSNYQGGGAV